MTDPRAPSRPGLAPCRFLWVLVPALACVSCGGGTSALRLQSEQGTIEPVIRTAVYRRADANTADIYLSDIPPEAIVERLAAGRGGEAGTVIHLHIFLAPKAGRTPIDFTASNTTATCVILTGGPIGVYGGGGFLLPSARIGDGRFTGRIRDATLRLVESDAGFDDRLGLPWLSGTINARRDDPLASLISQHLTRLLLN